MQVRESQKKEDTAARNVRKVANRYVFPMTCGSGGSKSRLPKAAGAEVAVQQGNEKLHAAVARSTFKSKCTKHILAPLLEVQMLQDCPPLWRGAEHIFPHHFLRLGCGKIARRCGAKHIFKSKCAKKKHSRTTFFEVGMWKNCTSLWREAQFQVKMCKTHQSRTTF